MELKLKCFLLFNYLGEKGLDLKTVDVVLALEAAKTGLLLCAPCPSFKEFKGTRPGPMDFFREAGLSWNNNTT